MIPLERRVQQPVDRSSENTSSVAKAQTTAPIQSVANERRYAPEQAADILTRLEMRKEEDRRKEIHEQAEQDLRHVTKEEEDDRIPQSRLYTILEERGFEREAIDDIITTHYPSAQQQRKFFTDAGVIPTADRFIAEGMAMYEVTFLHALREAYPGQEFTSKAKRTYDGLLEKHHAHLHIQHREASTKPPSRNPIVRLWRALLPTPLKSTPIVTVRFDDVFNYKNGAVWGDICTYLQSPKTIALEDQFDELENTLKRASKAGGSLFNVSRQRTYSAR